MTTQRTRTPRRRKVWATDWDPALPITMASGVQVTHKPLEAYRQDLGMNKVEGVTVMRTRGVVYLGNAASESASTNYFVRIGLVWLQSFQASQSGATSVIPDPGNIGLNEASWIWRQGL